MEKGKYILPVTELVEELVPALQKSSSPVMRNENIHNIETLSVVLITNPLLFPRIVGFVNEVRLCTSHNTVCNNKNQEKDHSD